MRTFRAFIKKEWQEAYRTGKLVTMSIIFFLFGLMNPAIAKLTPMVMKMMSEEMEASGVTVGEIRVDATSSWTQFYSNTPLALVVLILLFAGIFAVEYQRGTMVLAVSKGASKVGIFWAKALTLLLIWTGGFAITFLVTWFYTGYYWDNSVMNHLFFGVGMYFLFGINVIACLLFFAVISNNNYTAMLGAGAYYAIQLLLGTFKSISKYLPTFLAGGMNLGLGKSEMADFTPAIVTSSLLTVCFLLLGSFCIGKMQKN